MITCWFVLCPIRVSPWCVNCVDWSDLDHSLLLSPLHITTVHLRIRMMTGCLYACVVRSCKQLDAHPVCCTLSCGITYDPSFFPATSLHSTRFPYIWTAMPNSPGDVPLVLLVSTAVLPPYLTFYNTCASIISFDGLWRILFLACNQNLSFTSPWNCIFVWTQWKVSHAMFLIWFPFSVCSPLILDHCEHSKMVYYLEASCSRSAYNKWIGHVKTTRQEKEFISLFLIW